MFHLPEIVRDLSGRGGGGGGGFFDPIPPDHKIFLQLAALRQNIYYTSYGEMLPSFEEVLEDAKVTGRIEQSVTLAKLDLRNIYMPGVFLYKANLSGLDFTGANLSGAILKEANLSRCKFMRSNLEDAHLDGAFIHSATFLPSHIKCADFSDAKFAGTNLPISIFGETKLSGATGLDKCLYGLTAGQSFQIPQVSHLTIISDRQGVPYVIPADKKRRGMYVFHNLRDIFSHSIGHDAIPLAQVYDALIKEEVIAKAPRKGDRVPYTGLRPV